jgi:hypothetical protein
MKHFIAYERLIIILDDFSDCIPWKELNIIPALPPSVTWIVPGVI